MKHTFKTIGGILVFIGIMILVMDNIYVFQGVLAWMYSWGDSVAWCIKISFIAVGLLLAGFSKHNKT